MRQRLSLSLTTALILALSTQVFAQGPAPAPVAPVAPSAPAVAKPATQPSATAKYEDLNTAAPVTPPKPAAAGLTASDDGMFLNAVDTDIREIIKQISKVTGKNFLIDDKIKGKVTILSEKKMTTEEAYQAFLSALEVLGFTVVSGPGDLVKIIPLKDALVNPIPIFKDDSPFTDSFITRLITMKSVSALDIAAAVKPLISKEGNLFAYPATNTLIVTDSGTNIDRLLKIIKEMDTQGPEQVLEMIAIKNAAAKDVADKIQKLYLDQQGGAAKRAGAKPGELDDIPYISKVISDDRTNSIIVLAAKRAVSKVRELVARLDRPLEGPQGKIHVYYLKNGEAAKMAQVLAAMTSGSGSKSSTPGAPSTPGARPGAVTAGGGAPVTAEFEGGVKVAADESTNSLIITATQKDYETLVKEVIEKLDIPRRQVYVEVVIMELTVDKNRQLGIQGQGGATFSAGGNKIIGFGSALGGTASGLASALSGASAGGIVSQNTISFPTTNADGTVKNVNVPAFGAILTALQQDRDVNILSTPNLLTLDNEEAEIIVGGEEPFPTGSTLTTGGNTTFNVTRQNVGITLKLTPQVSEGDMVKMKIKQEVTAVVPGASEAVLTSVGPSTTKRSVTTVVVAKDQQTIVIGGLIDDKQTIAESKIPFLGDIPLLGNLFKTKKRTKAKTNILVFLRPYIIRDTTDFLKILQKKVEERNMFIEQNYGRTQQKAIRESIRSHASELLEFKKDIQLNQYDYEKVTPKSKLDQVGSDPAVKEKEISTEAKPVEKKKAK
ncbi:MAG: type II secretion system secretin GspD [Deltaproteobacteria bacterium]|nr:type II secretion system secretin GspD [Deltaproteobacteria bacterium]